MLENVSSLLLRKLSNDKSAVYQEQSISFNQKDKHGRYRYQRLPYLKKSVQKQYIETLDQIFDTYSDLIVNLTHYINASSSSTENKESAEAQAYMIARSVLPVASTTAIEIFASEAALNSIAIRLLSDKLPESREAGRKILRTDIGKEHLLNIGYQALTRENVKKIADKSPVNNSSDSHGVNLSDLWPKDELDIVPEILYEHSSLSLNEIKKEVKDWSAAKKSKVLKAYIGDRLNKDHSPGQALAKIHYFWDILCDYATFADLPRDIGAEWQLLTPRYGFEVPKLVEDAGLADDFEKCFDLSLELYSLMQQHGYEQEAQYATLFGHRMRWKMSLTANQAIDLIENSDIENSEIMKMMHAKITKIHPAISRSIKLPA